MLCTFCPPLNSTTSAAGAAEAAAAGAELEELEEELEDVAAGAGIARPDDASHTRKVLSQGTQCATRPQKTTPNSIHLCAPAKVCKHCPDTAS